MMNPIVDAAKGIVEGIAAPIDAVGKIMNQKEANNLAQQEMSMRPDMAQVDINKIEAELKFADDLYKKIGCLIINVAQKSIEETASIILSELNLEDHSYYN